MTCVGISVALGGCARGVEVASAHQAARSFVDAWDEGDEKEMIRWFAGPMRRRWTAEGLQSWLRRALVKGEVQSLDVELDGAVAQPEVESEQELASGLSTSAPYRLTYSSDAAAEPIRLEGNLRLVYSPKKEQWAVAWNKRRLWPGIKGAAGFEVVYRWPKRAPILDRSGRALARGAASSRVYPFRSVGGATIGHVGRVTKGQLEEGGRDYRVGDLAGGSGVEAAFDERLAGKPTTKVTVVNGRARTVAVLGRRNGRPGRPVRTTLDVDVQRAAEEAYGGNVGGAVVVEPRSGNVLAVVSGSAFDPNYYVGAEGVSTFNRALSGLYPPGSAMKVVTASAALDTGEVSPETRLSGPVEYKGVRNFESESFPRLSFADAVTHSVNTAFAQVAERLGPKRLWRYARAFGFGSKPKGRLLAATSSFPFPRDLGDLLWSAVGQAQVLATPLEMATVAATVANGGTRMEPRISFVDHKQGRAVVSRKTAGTMAALMQAVVRGGTGTGAAIPGVAVAGKTGTAEVNFNGVIRNHAWFICFAPATRPKVAVAVVVEYGGVGGEVAAPLAGAIVQRVLPLI